MSDWGSGFVVGIATGLAIGLTASRKSKPWSELSEKEKKIRTVLIIILGASVLAGIVALLLVR
jgi:hypothetical protein